MNGILVHINEEIIHLASKLYHNYICSKSITFVINFFMLETAGINSCKNTKNVELPLLLTLNLNNYNIVYR